jgi:hypothetical protein
MSLMIFVTVPSTTNILLVGTDTTGTALHGSGCVGLSHFTPPFAALARNVRRQRRPRVGWQRSTLERGRWRQTAAQARRRPATLQHGAPRCNTARHVATARCNHRAVSHPLVASADALSAHAEAAICVAGCSVQLQQLLAQRRPLFVGVFQDQPIDEVILMSRCAHGFMRVVRIICTPYFWRRHPYPRPL